MSFLQVFAKPFAGKVEITLERCDLILALGKEILQNVKVREATSLTEEIMNLARANVESADTDGNGVPGSSPGEYGLKKLRSQLEQKISCTIYMCNNCNKLQIVFVKLIRNNRDNSAI